MTMERLNTERALETLESARRNVSRFHPIKEHEAERYRQAQYAWMLTLRVVRGIR